METRSCDLRNWFHRWLGSRKPFSHRDQDTKSDRVPSCVWRFFYARRKCRVSNKGFKRLQMTRELTERRNTVMDLSITSSCALVCATGFDTSVSNSAAKVIADDPSSAVVGSGMLTGMLYRVSSLAGRVRNGYLTEISPLEAFASLGRLSAWFLGGLSPRNVVHADTRFGENENGLRYFHYDLLDCFWIGTNDCPFSELENTVLATFKQPKPSPLGFRTGREIK